MYTAHWRALIDELGMLPGVPEIGTADGVPHLEGATE